MFRENECCVHAFHLPEKYRTTMPSSVPTTRLPLSAHASASTLLLSSGAATCSHSQVPSPSVVIDETVVTLLTPTPIWTHAPTCTEPYMVPCAIDCTVPVCPAKGPQTGVPSARSHTCTVWSSLPEMTTGRPSSSAAATARTHPVWPVNGSATGVRVARSHTLTVWSPLPEITTGRPSSSAVATARTHPVWPVKGSPTGARVARSHTCTVWSLLPEMTTGR